MAFVTSAVFIDRYSVIPFAEVVYYRTNMLPGDKLLWKTGL